MCYIQASRIPACSIQAIIFASRRVGDRIIGSEDPVPESFRVKSLTGIIQTSCPDV